MNEIPGSSDPTLYTRYNANNNVNQGSKLSNAAKCNKVFILKLTAIIASATVVIVVGSVALYKFVKDEDLEDCDEGFFRPVDDNDESICYPCILENCKNCQGKKDDNTCTQCKGGFGPLYDSGNVIINCTKLINPNFLCGDKCVECDQIEEKCAKCESGYFVPDNSNTKYQCEKCSLTNCAKCEGNENADICISCTDDFVPKYDENEHIKYCNDICQIGDNDKCRECDLGENECIDCNPGYYIPSDDDIRLKCQRCSLDNCQFCHGTKDSNICDLCDDNYEPQIENDIIKSCIIRHVCETGDGDKCLTCSNTDASKCGSCNPNYKLTVDGKCEFDVTPSSSNEYITITAKYSTDKKIPVPIIGEGKYIYIKKMKVDNVLKESNIPVDFKGNYYFEKSSLKEHTIVFTFEINSYNILQNLFYKIGIVKSIVVDEVKNDNIEISLMNNMFYACTNLISVDISKIKTKDVINIDSMFYNCSSLTSVDLSKNIFTKVITANELFKNCRVITSINLNTEFPNLKYFHDAFYGCNKVESIDLSSMKPTRLIDIYLLFSRCYSLKSVNLNNFNTEYAENMYGVFHYCSNLTSIDLSNFKTPEAKDFKWMFFNCSFLKSLDFSSFDTSKVTDMKELCYNCESLTSINFGDNFNTEKVTDMSHMFYNCAKLKNIDLSKFRTPNVKSFVNIFCRCSSLTSIDLSFFDFTLSAQYYVGPPILHYCSSLKYIKMESIKFMIFRDFFTGIPDSGGKIFVSLTLYNQLRSMGIKVLNGWEWKILVG